MAYSVTNQDIDNINRLLKSNAKAFEDGWTWSILEKDSAKPMVFNLYSNIDLGGVTGSMISVQTRHGYYELHDISAIMYFEPDEVIFIHKELNYLSCLILGSECSCSLYSNISLDLLKTDITELHPAVLLSVMQLSITDNSIM